jgi:hypothetical protein
MNHLTAFALQRGDRAAAEDWAGRAARAGDVNGMINYGVLLLASGRNEEAKTWFGTALQAGGIGLWRQITKQVEMSGLTLP